MPVLWRRNICTRSIRGVDPSEGGTVFHLRQPNILLAFAVYAAIAILIASIVAVLVIRHNFEQNSRQKVAEHTRFVASAVVPSHLAVDEWRKPLAGRRLREFDEIVKRDLMTSGILRVKLFNAAGLTIYSSDGLLSGKRFDDSAELRKVLGGATIASFARLNHEGGIGKNSWTVEAYAPVYYPDRNRATGVFEFYIDHVVAEGSVRKQAAPLTIALLLMLVGLYVTLLPILRRTTRALALSNDELRLQAKDLKENLQVRTAIEQRLRETIKKLARSEERLEHSQEETILRLSTAVGSRDAETGSHIVRMGRFCELLAKKLGWDQDRCDLMRIASPLHDVGKIAMPDRVMLKAGALTSEERATMQEHAAIGYRILAGSESPLLDLAARIALTHHEKWDGSGYPNGLAGEEIPIEGRIAAIADVFDALTNDRVYRPAMSLDRAFAILADGHGTHFDPTILDVFFASIDDVLAIGDKPKRYRDG